ncbi:hypothetical protein TorRG33x02_330360 [Trema orientale]|uniref:Uncharacterized protein n=1 Tax=Trema orientale TaxID=63057 RepID=A0A2P5B7B7_TREOI|nr:hypothetical protein TorRG33x02_330360 [Trema orientale]
MWLSHSCITDPTVLESDQYFDPMLLELSPKNADNPSPNIIPKIDSSSTMDLMNLKPNPPLIITDPVAVTAEISNPVATVRYPSTRSFANALVKGRTKMIMIIQKLVIALNQESNSTKIRLVVKQNIEILDKGKPVENHTRWTMFGPSRWVDLDDEEPDVLISEVLKN